MSLIHFFMSYSFPLNISLPILYNKTWRNFLSFITIAGGMDEVDETEAGDMDDWVQCERKLCQKWYHIYCVSKMWQNNLVGDGVWFCCNSN